MSKDEDSDFQPTTLQNNVVKHTRSGRRGKVKLHVRREGGREGGREREREREKGGREQGRIEDGGRIEEGGMQGGKDNV